MKYISTKQSFLIPSLTTDCKETRKIDKYLSFLEVSGIFEFYHQEYIKKGFNPKEGGRPPVNPYDLIALILYAFAFGKASLREMEDLCKFDLRAIYIMNYETPNYVTIGNFINDFFVPHRHKIFALLTRSLFTELNLSMDDAFLDGSKFEADANKFKFVWKPTTFHQRLNKKVFDLMKKYELIRGINENEMISAVTIADKTTELTKKFENVDLELKENKQLKKDLNQLWEYLYKSLEYEEKERICGPHRNSYYKTDHDATAMTLKTDYYSGLASNMHAAYNVQIMVSYGLISAYLATQSRSDINDFIPIIQRYYLFYGQYPKRLCADAGYGSLSNYTFLKTHHIENYVKYKTWEGNISGKSPSQYEINDDDSITCLNGIIGKKINIPHRHPKNEAATFYRIEGCKACSFKEYCKRFMKKEALEDNYKIFEVVPDLQHYIKESETNLLSVTGIEMRVNRSIQVEGAFGVIKQDMAYTRFRRTTLEKIETEFMLVCCGYNIRKLFKYYSGNAKLKYWKAPKNIQAERKKKPSAKRLSKKASNRKEKSLNQKAKNYKYKT